MSVSHCYWTCLFTIYKGDAALRVVDAKSIQSVVSMIPYFKILENGNFETPATQHFLVEKPGLDLALFLGGEVVDNDDDDELYV